MSEQITHADVAQMVEALRGEASRLLARSRRRDAAGPRNADYRVEQLLDVAAPAPAGLDAGQREVLAAALADASSYREGRASDSYCADCEADPSGLCADHAADLDLHDAYVQLATELGIELDR